MTHIIDRRKALTAVAVVAAEIEQMQRFIRAVEVMTAEQRRALLALMEAWPPKESARLVTAPD